MKLIFVTLLSIFFYVYSSFTFATEKTVQIVCDQHVSALSDQFSQHWAKTPMPWYASWAHDEMGNFLFTGGMGTTKDKFPDDTNPHLSFVSPYVVYDSEQGEIVMCRYQIGNPELRDIDNILEMRAFTYLPKNACVVTSSDTVKCRE